MGKHVLAVGSTCVDVVVRLDHLPVSEEDMHIAGQSFRMGGCAYNVASVLGRAGSDVTLVTPVGLRGLFGPYVMSRLGCEKWARPVVLPEGENGCCYCLVEKNGERTFLSLHGAEYTFDPSWVEGERTDITYVCGLEVEEATGGALVEWLGRADAGQIVYAPGPRGMRVPEARTRALLALHPWLHLSRAEALALSGEEDVARAMEKLSAVTQRPVIVTLGAEGACAMEAGVIYRAAARKARVADTIGAGDAHCAGMIWALSEGLCLEEGLRRAGELAARAVETEGAEVPADAVREALGIR